MTEEVKSVSDMVRLTATNSIEFMRQIADHIDKLESGIIALEKRIAELESEVGHDTTAQ
jgi:hypothetical protein